MNKRGFSLIELLVYLSSSLLLYAATLQLMHLFQATLQQKTRGVDISLDIAIALEALNTDIASLAYIPAQWKETALSNLIFNNGHVDIGWIVDTQRLIRITGDYCQATKKWKRKAVTVFLRHIHLFECIYFYKNGLVHAIRCTVEKLQGSKPLTISSLMTIPL